MLVYKWYTTPHFIAKKKKVRGKKKITAPQGSLTLHWYTKRNEINQDETAKNNGTLFFVFHQAERNKSYGHDMILYKHIQKKKQKKINAHVHCP